MRNRCQQGRSKRKDAAKGMKAPSRRDRRRGYLVGRIVVHSESSCH